MDKMASVELVPPTGTPLEYRDFDPGASKRSFPERTGLIGSEPGRLP
jgi:hypothetical protein